MALYDRLRFVPFNGEDNCPFSIPDILLGHIGKRTRNWAEIYSVPQ